MRSVSSEHTLNSKLNTPMFKHVLIHSFKVFYIIDVAMQINPISWKNTVFPPLSLNHG